MYDAVNYARSSVLHIDDRRTLDVSNGINYLCNGKIINIYSKRVLEMDKV